MMTQIRHKAFLDSFQEFLLHNEMRNLKVVVSDYTSMSNKASHGFLGKRVLKF